MGSHYCSLLRLADAEDDDGAPALRLTECIVGAGVRWSGTGLISSIKKESPMVAVASVFGVAISFISFDVSTDMGGN